MTGLITGLIAVFSFHAQDVVEGHRPFQAEPDVRVAGVRRAAGLCSGDFNGDRRPDLAMLSGVSGQVGILLSQGGDFQSARPKLVRVGDSASGLTIGDFNEDGKLDAAVCHHDTDEIWLLIGNGDGAFAPARKLRVPVSKPHAHQIESADLNRDNHLDLIFAQADDNRVWALLGDGKGGFTPSAGSPCSTGNHPYVVATADFNRDGHLDFATPNWYGKSVSVFLGDGTGCFQQAPDSPLTGFKAPTALDAGDLTGDGVIDLALGQDDSSEIQVLVGNGVGAFAVGVVPALKAQAECFAPTLADLNKDGRLDVIATAQNNARTCSYWINLGGGKFSPPQGLACSTVATTLCVAELNGDGMPDLAAGSDGSDQTLIWFGQKR